LQELNCNRATAFSILGVIVDFAVTATHLLY